MKVLLIPSAKLIPSDMQKDFGNIPAILYPLNNVPMLDHLYNQYKNTVDIICIAVSEKKELVTDYIKYKNYDVRVVALDKICDLGYTVLYALDALFQQGVTVDSLTVNFADTLVGDDCATAGGDVILFSNAAPDKKWTFFTYDDEHGIVSIRDKAESADEDAQPLPLFVGTQCFARPALLHTLLRTNAAVASKTDSFWRAVQAYSEQVHMEYRFVSQWFDVGHSENYFKAKTGVEARMFNTLQIDDKRGIMQKTSDNKEKFVQEIKWYLRLPEQLQYLAPRIYQYSVSPEHPYISMEYYGYNTLHEIFLYSDLPLYRWQSIFEKLLFIVNDMSRYRVECSAEETGKALREMYVTKTISRMLTLRADKRFTPFFEQPVTVNGKRYQSLDAVMALLPALLERVVIDGYAGGFNIIHGDLHFSNILTEANYGFMRLVDPRGCFGSFDLYGDPRYEIAKLMHSLDGKYDFIIEDMFRVDVDRDSNAITFETMEKPQALYGLFQEVFRDKMQQPRALKLIEATLFLSMIPLHGDVLKRQYAMLATGLRLLDEAMQDDAQCLAWHTEQGR